MNNLPKTGVSMRTTDEIVEIINNHTHFQPFFKRTSLLYLDLFVML